MAYDGRSGSNTYIGVVGMSMAFADLFPVLMDPKTTWGQKWVASALIVASVFGARAGIEYAAAARGNPGIVAELTRPATVAELVDMMNKRPDTTAAFAEGDALAYLEKIGAEGSHMLMDDGTSAILLRLDVATRRTALHEWIHRWLQRRAGGPMPGEDDFIESFLSRHARTFQLGEE